MERKILHVDQNCFNARHLLLCRESGMYLCLRIGPWAHGEARNGGFPDWLLTKEFEVRTNDPGYLDEVFTFYRRILDQVKGHLLKDGGPVIAVQIENEYGHCGGLSGEEGERHMRTLTPEFLCTPSGFERMENDGELAVYQKRIAENFPSASFCLSGFDDEHASYDIDLTYPDTVCDSFLHIEYGGKMAPDG